jgi:hypothetical protein
VAAIELPTPLDKDINPHGNVLLQRLFLVNNFRNVFLLTIDKSITHCCIVSDQYFEILLVIIKMYHSKKRKPVPASFEIMIVVIKALCRTVF